VTELPTLVGPLDESVDLVVLVVRSDPLSVVSVLTDLLVDGRHLLGE
jgi:hypothetical protein